MTHGRRHFFCTSDESCEGCADVGRCSDGTMLYLCDGNDPRCSDRDKSVCCRLVTGRPGCRHTPDVRHSASRIDPDFPETEFRLVGFGTPKADGTATSDANGRDVMIEQIRDGAISEEQGGRYAAYLDWAE